MAVVLKYEERGRARVVAVQVCFRSLSPLMLTFQAKQKYANSDKNVSKE